MTDLVERLRGFSPPDRTVDELRPASQAIYDAADEIERLREQLRLCNIDQCNAEARLAEAEKDRDEAQAAFEKTDELWAKDRSRLAEAEALLEDAKQLAEGDLMAVGHGAESFARTQAMSELRRYINRIDAFLTSAAAPAPDSSPEASEA